LKPPASYYNTDRLYADYRGPGEVLRGGMGSQEQGYLDQRYCEPHLDPYGEYRPQH
jgi:hypothetical protein